MVKKHLNFVWFCTDQQRWDTIRCMGNTFIKTPNLDRLAANGVAFENCYTQSPVCTPSRACFLTGRYPRSTKVFYNGNDKFPKDEILVTKLLADRDYTCGLVGKLHLTSPQGRMEKRTDDGYTFFKWSHHPHNDWPGGENDYQNWLKSKGKCWEEIYGGRYTSMSRWPPIENPGFKGKEIGVPASLHQTTWCVEEAIEFIGQSADKPWLISINPFDPHPPLDPPQEYKDRLKVEDMPLPLWREGELDNKPPHQQKDYLIGGQNGATDSITTLSDEDKREKIRDYYAEIELIDDQVGRLMDYLEETGQRENTVFIFTSDHGEMSGDHGLYWKGGYFYEGLVHVPLIISCPGTILCGGVSSALVELVDLAPTIMELAGYEVPDFMQGKSLAGLLTGELDLQFHKKSVYCEYYNCMMGCHEDIYGTMYYDGHYKIINYAGKEWGELYDLQNDPNEFENLWNQADIAALKADLLKKSYDQVVLNNLDYSMDKKFEY